MEMIDRVEARGGPSARLRVAFEVDDSVSTAEELIASGGSLNGEPAKPLGGHCTRDSQARLDPLWNPASEAQAVDRAHRIWQARNVLVYRLVAKDTVEEKVMALKAKKSQLFADVMEGDALAGGRPGGAVRGVGCLGGASR
ncbi:DEAD/DEAH box helicase [Arthrobacter sp. FW306-04-A]|nr:DEAD/DEAH box helicase [Arthrobacter sp. FW306-04-A]